MAEQATGSDRKLVVLVVETKDIDVNHDEAIFYNGECVGYVTSGGYAHYVKKSVALGYVPAELAVKGNQFEVEIIGELKPAVLIDKPLYDPSGVRMRS